MFFTLIISKINFRHFGKKSFCKDSASREKKKELARFFLPRRRLSYGKIVQAGKNNVLAVFLPRRRLSYGKMVQAERRKKSLLDFFCRGAAYLMERWCKHFNRCIAWSIKSRCKQREWSIYFLFCFTAFPVFLLFSMEKVIFVKIRCSVLQLKNRVWGRISENR